MAFLLLPKKSATTSRFSYRSIRIWGTIGYGVGAQLAGLAYENLFPESLCLFFALGILLSVMGVLGSHRSDENAVQTDKSLENAGSLKALLTNRLFWGYLLIAGLFYATTNLNSTYLPNLYQQDGVYVFVPMLPIFILHPFLSDY